MEYILDNGKYRILRTEVEFKAFRYGEEWRDLTGDNLILHLLFQIDDNVEIIARLRSELEQVTNQRDTLRKLVEAKDMEHLLYADKLEKHIMKQAGEIGDLHVEIKELEIRELKELKKHKKSLFNKIRGITT